MMVTMQETAAPVVLGIGDGIAGCDACGPEIPAMYVILLPSGRQLTFCGHHTRELGFLPLLAE